MKKITLLLFLVISIYSNAQGVFENSEKEHLKLFIGAGALFVDNYEINNYLSQNNIQTITPVQINGSA